MDQNVPNSQSAQSTSTPLRADPGLQPSNPTPPPDSSAPSPKRFSKKILIVGVVILVILIAVAIYFFMPKSDLKQTNINQPGESTFPYAVVNSQGTQNTDVIKEMAREISDYVLSQRLPDGYYNYLAHYDQQCTEENGERVCPFNGVNMFQTTNAWTALALFSASKILNDSNLLENAKQDLNKLEQYCAVDRAQCNWVLAQPAIIYQTTQDPELLDFLRLQGETLLSSAPSEDAMLVAIEARELALLYEIFQDTRYIVAAQNRLLLSSQKLNDQPDMYPESTQRYAVSSCWVGLANAQLAKSTQNEQEKNNTSVFLENGKISNNFTNFPQPIEIQPCIESFSLVGNIAEKQTLLDKFLENFYDGPQRELVYGEGGTTYLPYVDSRKIVLTDSAYTLYLIYLLHNI